MIDLRSDTVTRPTDEMREAIFNAPVGDDMYGEDPTMNRLEGLASDMLGKESALFVTSGIQGNLIATLCQTSRGDEIILADDSHMIVSETGGLASIAGVQTRTLEAENGQFKLNELTEMIRTEEDVHKPRTSLVCVENTHGNSGGSVLPVTYLQSVHDIARENGLSVHMDGARIFNAAQASSVDVKEIASYADTVMFCVSKGLGAPMGSIIAGPKDFIEKARRWRKALGGATRQSGIVGAAGIVSLEKMTERLTIDHENARALRDGLENSALEVINENVETNILLVSIKSLNVTMPRFLSLLEAEGVLVSSIDFETLRFVTHHEISSDDIENAIDAILKVESEIPET